MRAVVQRVARASVRVEGEVTGQIERGLLVLLGIGKTDTPAASDWMIEKILKLRIFPDEAGKMNKSVTDIAGGILVVSQFTLYGELEKGTRPSFSGAMSPEDARKFYDEFMRKLRAATTLPVAEGRFAAMMDVELVNDGPVTILLETPAKLVGQASRLSPSHDKKRTGETPVPLFQSFDPRSPATITHRHLPHWRQAGCTYFVTFRLADSLPVEKLRQLVKTQDRKQVLPEIQQCLDAGHGECWLRQPSIAGIVAGALRHFHGQRYDLGAFVVMPNHVHAVVSPSGEWPLEHILHSWKSFTAHKINEALHRTGAVWQDESFDHVVRDEHRLREIEDYIRQNPAKAKLREGEYFLGDGQAGRLSH